VDSSTAGDLAGVAALLVTSALFTAGEAGLLGASLSRVRKLAGQGDRAARLVEAMIRQRGAVLAVVLLGITACNYTAERLVIEIALGINSVWGPLVAAAVMTVVVLVFCEVVPIQIGAKAPEDTARRIAPFIFLAAILLAPLVAGLWLISRGVLWLMGVRGRLEEAEVSEQYLRAIIDASEAQGVLDEGERLMLHRALGFADRTAAQVMTPRTEVVAVEVGTSIGEAIRISLKSGSSRLPVYRERIDNVVGVFYLKDALGQARAKALNQPVETIARSALFVPDSLPADQLLHRLQTAGRTLAIVKDEFGGTAGIVTVEDLLEEIVGAIQDEYDAAEQPEIMQVGPDRWLCDGLASPHLLEETTNVELPPGEWDTVSGVIIAHLGRLPRVGEVVRVGRLELGVERIFGTRVERVHVRKLPRSSQTGENESLPADGNRGGPRGEKSGG
jgi:putative hemolysin